MHPETPLQQDIAIKQCKLILGTLIIFLICIVLFLNGCVKKNITDEELRAIDALSQSYASVSW